MPLRETSIKKKNNCVISTNWKIDFGTLKHNINLTYNCFGMFDAKKKALSSEQAMFILIFSRLSSKRISFFIWQYLRIVSSHGFHSRYLTLKTSFKEKIRERNILRPYWSSLGLPFERAHKVPRCVCERGSAVWGGNGGLGFRVWLCSQEAVRLWATSLSSSSFSSVKWE